MDKRNFEKENVFGLGSENTAFAKFFTGKSYLNPLTEAGEGKLFFANVTFEPGCRNNWHIHHATAGGGDGRAYGGHLKRAVIGATCELVLRTADIAVGRKTDEVTGLNVFDFTEVL